MRVYSGGRTRVKDFASRVRVKNFSRARVKEAADTDDIFKSLEDLKNAVERLEQGRPPRESSFDDPTSWLVYEERRRRKLWYDELRRAILN